MGWLRTLVLRLLLFCSIAFPLGCCLTLDYPKVGPSLFRVVLWIAAVVTMFVDWSLLNRRILEYQKAFTTCAENSPPRWENWTHSFRGLALFALIWLPVQCARANDDTEPGPWLVGVLLLTVTCALWWTLFLGGFTWLRYRLKGFVIPKDMRPSGRPPAPWAVAASMAPVLWLVFFGAEGAVVLAALGTHMATAEEDRVEVLVELGPDDSIDEVRGTIVAFGGHAQPAFPSIDMGEDADLAQTWLVTVPQSAAPGLVVALSFRPEDVDHIELNSAVPLGREVSSGACIPSVTVNSARSWYVEPKLVAVIDTGVDSSHPDFYGVVRGESRDLDGHGTAVAGLIGGFTRRGCWRAHVRQHGQDERVRRRLSDRVRRRTDVPVGGVDATVDGPPHVSQTAHVEAGAGCVVGRGAGLGQLEHHDLRRAQRAVAACEQERRPRPPRRPCLHLTLRSRRPARESLGRSS